MQYITSDGVVLHYKRQGTGEPLLFIHGLASNLQSWHYQFEYFASHFDTLAYDCRGHGHSTIPEQLSMGDHTQDAYELCKLFEQPVTVVGISMGGYIAQSLLIKHPEIVKSAVLIATKSHGKGTATSKAIDSSQENRDPLQVRFDFVRNFLFGPDVTDEMIHAFIRMEPPMPPDQFELVNGAIREFDYRPELPECTQPVLVLHGDHDRLIPPEFGEELAKILPNSKFVTIPRAGHAVIAEKPQEVNQTVMDFITE